MAMHHCERQPTLTAPPLSNSYCFLPPAPTSTAAVPPALASSQALNWNSLGMEDYLFEANKCVREVDDVLRSIQDHVSRTRAILAQWQHDLMFERKDGRVGQLGGKGGEARRQVGCLWGNAHAWQQG